VPLRAPDEMRVLKVATVPGAASPYRPMFSLPRETGSEHSTDLSPKVLFWRMASGHIPMSRYTLSVMEKRSVVATACEDGEGEGKGGVEAAWEGMSVATSGIAIVKATRDALLFVDGLNCNCALESVVDLVLWVFSLVC